MQVFTPSLIHSRYCLELAWPNARGFLDESPRFQRHEEYIFDIAPSLSQCRFSLHHQYTAATALSLLGLMLVVFLMRVLAFSVMMLIRFFRFRPMVMLSMLAVLTASVLVVVLIVSIAMLVVVPIVVPTVVLIV